MNHLLNYQLLESARAKASHPPLLGQEEFLMPIFKISANQSDAKKIKIQIYQFFTTFFTTLKVE